MIRGLFLILGLFTPTIVLGDRGYHVNGQINCGDRADEGHCQTWLFDVDVDHRHSACFPEDTIIRTCDGTKPMKDLKIGDSVVVNTGNKDVCEPVTLWLHRITNATVVYRRIHTNYGFIDISPKHNIMFERDNYVSCDFAQKVRKGDYLITKSGHKTVVLGVTAKRKMGVYAPHTSTGNIYVGDEYMQYLSHTFANIKNPHMYVWLFNKIVYFHSRTNDLTDDTHYIHPTAKYLADKFGYYVTTPKIDMKVVEELANRLGSIIEK